MNYEFAAFGAGKKTAADFLRLERRIEQLKIRFDDIRVQIDLHLGEIEAANEEIGSYLRPDKEERELMAVVTDGCAELSRQLLSWQLKIDDAVDEADRVLAECVLDMPSGRSARSDP